MLMFMNSFVEKNIVQWLSNILMNTFDSSWVLVNEICQVIYNALIDHQLKKIFFHMFAHFFKRTKSHHMFGLFHLFYLIIIYLNNLKIDNQIKIYFFEARNNNLFPHKLFKNSIQNSILMSDPSQHTQIPMDFNILPLFIDVLLYYADVITDILSLVEYYKNNYLFYFGI